MMVEDLIYGKKAEDKPWLAIMARKSWMYKTVVVCIVLTKK